MSFTSEVKDELIQIVPKARHCQLAELAAIVHFAGKSVKSGSQFDILVENEYASQKYFTLLAKTFNIKSVDTDLTEALKLELSGETPGIGSVADERLLFKDCCRRSFVRGAFLSGGTVSDPNKGYHMEFACRDAFQAAQLMDILMGYDIECHAVPRGRNFGVYIKEGESIVSVLGLMGASVSLMNLENTRIYRELSNTVNRRVNCETANIAKTVNASARQIEDIEYIRDNYGFDRLSGKLREMARIRLMYPEATLPELGEHLDPPVGKSGVNHRLRQLSELARQIRTENEPQGISVLSQSDVK